MRTWSLSPCFPSILPPTLSSLPFLLDRISLSCTVWTWTYCVAQADLELEICSSLLSNWNTQKHRATSGFSSAFKGIKQGQKWKRVCCKHSEFWHLHYFYLPQSSLPSLCCFIMFVNNRISGKMNETMATTKGRLFFFFLRYIWNSFWRHIKGTVISCIRCHGKKMENILHEECHKRMAHVRWIREILLIFEHCNWR